MHIVPHACIAGWKYVACISRLNKMSNNWLGEQQQQQ
jgi:hypothetical protein